MFKMFNAFHNILLNSGHLARRIELALSFRGDDYIIRHDSDTFLWLMQEYLDFYS